MTKLISILWMFALLGLTKPVPVPTTGEMLKCQISAAAWAIRGLSASLGQSDQSLYYCRAAVAVSSWVGQLPWGRHSRTHD